MMRNDSTRTRVYKKYEKGEYFNKYHVVAPGHYRTACGRVTMHEHEGELEDISPFVDENLCVQCRKHWRTRLALKRELERWEQDRNNRWRQTRLQDKATYGPDVTQQARDVMRAAAETDAKSTGAIMYVRERFGAIRFADAVRKQVKTEYDRELGSQMEAWLCPWK